MDRCLGGLLPHQLANPTRAHPKAINLSPVILSDNRAYAVLATVSSGYPPPRGRFPRVTHPCAGLHGSEDPLLPRLACVRPAASVRSEPGSNSQVDSSQNSSKARKPQNRSNRVPSRHMVHLYTRKAPHETSRPKPRHPQKTKKRCATRNSPFQTAARASLPFLPTMSNIKT